MQSAWTALLTCQREFKYPASRRRETQTAAGPYFARAVTFLVSDSTRRGRRCRHTYLRASGRAGTEPALSLSAAAGARSGEAGRSLGPGGRRNHRRPGVGPPGLPPPRARTGPGPLRRPEAGAGRTGADRAAGPERRQQPGRAGPHAVRRPPGRGVSCRPCPPLLTVPGRAHELVQQGPHLCLGRHGGTGPEAAAPTGTGAWGGGGGSAASAAATGGKR